MRIAQVSPLYESVPPSGYGGTERIVSFLTEELVKQGHDVTLFASGDSSTSAKLVPGFPTSLRTSSSCTDPLAIHFVMLEHVFAAAKEFDLIHFHVDYLHYPYSRRMTTPHLTTLHGNLGLAELQALYTEYKDMPVVSISHSQKSFLPHAHWVGTVHHGLPDDLYSFNEKPGKYLAFLGRISREKRVDRAIEIAKKSGLPLRIAAKIDPSDRHYFDSEIKRLLDDPLITFVGEIDAKQKRSFLGEATCLLFPIDWNEPFGLVMIEALACGTPVIAWDMGATTEVIENGVNGFLVKSTDEAIVALKRISTISRRKCRETFEKRFLNTRMVKEYLQIYQQLLPQRKGSLVAA